jgi:transketolase
MRKSCLDMVHALAKRDSRVVYIGSDPGAGTLDSMRKEFPERFFIEGISEAHVIGMSAGMAFEGYLPYVNTIATFLTRRCFEQVAVDVCLHSLPVRLIGNGGGLVYAPLGPTHVAMEDIAIMRALPNMTIVCPTDAEEMKRFMERTLDWPRPIYIRLGKGGDPITSRPDERFEIGKAIIKRDPGDVLIVTTGIMVHHVLGAAKLLAARGVHCGIAHFHTVKPLDQDTLIDLAAGVESIVTVEEHTRIGGLGSAVLECLADRLAVAKPLLRLGLPDRFTHNYGSQDSLLKHYALDADGIAASVERFVAGGAAQSAPAASAPSLERI